MRGRRLKPLNCIQQRDLLAAKDTPPEIFRAYGEAYLQAGALDDAINFFQTCGDRAGMAEVKRLAIAQGNAHLLFRIADAIPDSVTEEDWWATATAAVQLGKEAYACQALAKLGQMVEARLSKDKLAAFSFAGESDQERLLRTRQQALERGHAFQLLRIAAAFPGTISREEWQRAGEAALSRGNDAYAALAWLKAGLRDRLEEILRRYTAAPARGEDREEKKTS